MVRQIPGAQKSPQWFEIGLDPPGDFSLVEGLPARPANPFQRRRQMGIGEDLPRAGGPPLQSKGLQEAGPLPVDGHALLPVPGNDFRDRKPLPGIFNRGSEQFLHRQLPEAVVEGVPAVHTSRHGNGERAPGGQPAQTSPLQFFQPQGIRRAAAAVQPGQGLCAGLPDQSKKISSDPARDRLHQAQHCIGRNGAIYGGPPFFENIESHLGGQGLAGGSHSVAGQHLGAGGPPPAGYRNLQASKERNPRPGSGIHSHLSSWLV